MSKEDARDMNEPLRLLHKLNLHITTVHLDMGGQNRYSLSAKAHRIIDEIKLYLSQHPNKSMEPTTSSKRVEGFEQ